jgi:transposase
LVVNYKPMKRDAYDSVDRKPKIRTVNRKQLVLHPVDVEHLIDADHPARAIWELVGELDLQPFYDAIESEEGEAGRSAFDPRMLISMWVYAYSRGIGSAREISRLCESDPAFEWLTGLQSINAHTLSDFRVGHQEALDELFVQVLGLLSAEGLLTLERVSQDGTMIRANASKKTFGKEDRIRQYLEAARGQVAAMGDPSEEPKGQERAKARRRAAARERAERLGRAFAEVEKLRDIKRPPSKKTVPRVSSTDPHARIMRHSEGGYAPSYHVQLSVDSEAGLIAAVSVTNSGNDREQLLPAMDRLEQIHGRKPKQVVADGAYTHHVSVVAMAERDIDYYSSWTKRPQGRSHQSFRGISKEFDPSRFHYASDGDFYTCPAGKILRYTHTMNRPNGAQTRTYRAAVAECRACPHHNQCCPRSLAGYRGRAVVRTVEHEAVTLFKHKMQTDEAKQIYRTRAQLAEFPNAWLKTKIGLRQFSVRGLTKVNLEAKWAALTFNIQRWLKLRPPPAISPAVA